VIGSSGSHRTQRHLLHVFPSFGVGGIQVRFAQVANRLGAGFRHTIIALDGVMTCKERLNAELSYELATPPSRNQNVLSRLFSCHHQLREIHPDLLLTYNWGAIEWALANRILPLSRHIHFEDGFSREEAFKQMPRRVHFRRFALSKATRIVVPSQTLAAIARTTWRLRPEQIAYIPNGIDPKRFERAREGDEAPSRWHRSGELIVGTVAPLRPEKNIGRLVRVFAVIAGRIKARLIIVGDGAERPALEALVRQLGLQDRVTFTGHARDPRDLLLSFDVFAMSSDTEQMPFNVLEAMAAGIAIVGVDVGDVKHMVAPENRWAIVPREDEQAFIDALAKLLTDEAARCALGIANRSRATLVFPEDAMIAAYRELYSL
jgi:L-malate glycosyltransferase